jgi:transcriptional regulator with XRE-family HTH domain
MLRSGQPGGTRSRKVPPVRSVRLAAGLTLTELAAAAGLDPSALSRFERGLTGVSLRSLLALARALDLKALAATLEPYDVHGDV